MGERTRVLRLTHVCKVTVEASRGSPDALELDWQAVSGKALEVGAGDQT